MNDEHNRNPTMASPLASRESPAASPSPSPRATLLTPGLVYAAVQKMNNSAALCLQIGHHDRAIASLAKALRVSRAFLEGGQRQRDEKHEGETKNSGSNETKNPKGEDDAMDEDPDDAMEDDQDENTSSSASASHQHQQAPVCGCHLCSLDGCLHFSEDHRRQLHRVLRASNNSNSGGVAETHQEETIRQRFLERRQQRRQQQQLRLQSQQQQEQNPSEILHHSHRPESPSACQQHHSKCSSSHHKSSCRHHKSCSRKNSSCASHSLANSSRGFFYRRIVQIPDLSLHACPETVGTSQITVLSLLSIFNLAVVYHLRAMEAEGHPHARGGHGPPPSNPLADLHKALGLYGVAHRALSEPPLNDDRSHHLQFRLVLANNLSHAHNLAGHAGRHEAYLKEVLSVAMSLIDAHHHRPWSHHHSPPQPLLPRQTDEDEPDLESLAGESMASSVGSSSTTHRCIDLEGFLANAAPLMTKAVCADAA